MTRRRLIYGALFGAGAAAAIALPGDRARLRTTRHRLAGGVAARIVHITDVHVGWSTPDALLARVARMVAAAEPDVVVMTGDYVNHSHRHLDRLRSFVACLPKPVVATLGNHDHWSGAGPIVDALEAEGVTVLVNASTTIGDLTIAGVDDARTKHDDVTAALSGVDPSRALILSHCPSAAPAIARAGGRVILSGHTHGGQVDIPIVTGMLARAAGMAFTKGWYEVGGARLYVNAGVGHSRRGLRHGRGAAPEVAVVELG
jgi:hypothetical protein